MNIYAIDHVQLAMPEGEEEKARIFYDVVLGIKETPKPPHLAQRGGVWFEQGNLKVHLGVEKDFRPAKKAHPAFLVNGLSDLIKKCQSAGYKVVSDEPLEGYNRVYINDPFGNRIELMEKIKTE
jgi:catechol 2,3-dioxygenase-like lactoylglutathione lyase family enzyme